MKLQVLAAIAVLIWTAFIFSCVPAYLRCMNREGWLHPLSKMRCEMEVLGLRR